MLILKFIFTNPLIVICNILSIMINDESKDNNENHYLNNKSKIITPTIGEAIKQAIKTGEEVVMQGETFAGESTGTIDNTTSEIMHEKENEIALHSTSIKENHSKIEVDVAESLDKTSVEDKIIIDTDEGKNKGETTVASIMSIPIEGDVKVQVQTEIEVPVVDDDKEAKAESKIKVETKTLSKELSLDHSFETSRENVNDTNNEDIKPIVFDKIEKSFEKALDETKENIDRYTEIMSKVKDSQSFNQNEKYSEMQESFTKSLEETTNNVERKTEKAKSDNNAIQENKGNNLQDNTTDAFSKSMKSYMNYQKQVLDSFQSFWQMPIKNNTESPENYLDMSNNFYNTCSEMIKNFTNNTIELNKLMSNILYSFMNAFYKKTE